MTARRLTRMLSSPRGESPIAQRTVQPPPSRPSDVPDEYLEAVYIGDDESVAELYKLRLELDGYRVRVVTTPIEAIAACRRRAPDIVFVDAGATNESVLEAIGSLRNHHQLSDVPIVLLQGGVTDLPPIGGLQVGVGNFLVRTRGSRSGIGLDGPVVSNQLH